MKEDTITSKEATFILKNNTDEDYAYDPSYYLEKKEDNKKEENEEGGEGEGEGEGEEGEDEGEGDE